LTRTSVIAELDELGASASRSRALQPHRAVLVGHRGQNRVKLSAGQSTVGRVALASVTAAHRFAASGVQLLQRADSLPAGTTDMADTKPERERSPSTRPKRSATNTAVTLDWLYRADHSMLPHHLAIEIARIEASEQEF